MSSKITNLTHFLYELGTLRKTARSHRQTLLTDDLSDNIASHSYRVSVIGLFLAHLEKANLGKVTTMCLLHDMTETRTGDQNWVHKKYLKTFDSEVASDQLTGLPSSKKLHNIFAEYESRNTKEAKIAKDADLLDQILLLKEYAWQGNREAERWLQDNEQMKKLSCRSAQTLAQEIVFQNPSDWWSSDGWTADRRK